MDQVFWLVLLFILGLVFGSFGNVVIWRLPRRESLSVPASHCPRCDAPIAWYDNVPVVSWILLRARCRACGEPISPRYPLVELASATLFLLAGAAWGITPLTLSGVVFFYGLLLLALVDWDTMRLPNSMVGPMAVYGLLAAGLAQVTDIDAGPLIGTASGGLLASPLAAALVGAVVGVAPALIVAEVYARVRKVDGFGGGDIKLLGAMGLFLGPYVLLALFLGSLMGSVYGVAVARRSEEGRRAKFPFGPFLAVGGMVVAVAGPEIWSWYVMLVTGP